MGPSPTFYARFGLDDPWGVAGSLGAYDEAEDPFVFLSAAPYYAELRRSAQARARLLRRLDESQQHRPLAGERFMQRRRPDTTVRSLRGLLSLGSSSIVWLEPEERHSEVPDNVKSGWAPRPTETKVASPRAVARAARTGITRKERETIERLLREVEVLPAAERVEVIRREVVRRVSAPIARQVIQEVERIVAERPRRATSVAKARMAAPGTRQLGLKPVLRSSPSLAVVAPHPAVRQQPRTVDGGARRRAVVPAARPEGAVEAPVALAVREARSQRVTSRGGPSPVSASMEAPAEPGRAPAPTQRVAELARSTAAPTARQQTAYGLQAIGLSRSPDAGVVTTRVVARTRAAASRPGALSPAVTAYLHEEPDQQTVPSVEVAPTQRSEVGRTHEVRRSRSVGAVPDTVVRPQVASDESAQQRVSGFASPRPVVASTPATARVPATVRAAARRLAPVQTMAPVTASPVSYVRQAAPQRAESWSAPARTPVSRILTREPAPAVSPAAPARATTPAPSASSPTLEPSAPGPEAPTPTQAVERRAEARGVLTRQLLRRVQEREQELQPTPATLRAVQRQAPAVLARTRIAANPTSHVWRAPTMDVVQAPQDPQTPTQTRSVWGTAGQAPAQAVTTAPSHSATAPVEVAPTPVQAASQRSVERGPEALPLTRQVIRRQQAAPVTTATVRAVERLEPQSAVRRSVVRSPVSHVRSTPTMQVVEPAAPMPQASTSTSSPWLRSASPSQRAVARTAPPAPRRDGRGATLLAPPPVVRGAPVQAPRPVAERAITPRVGPPRPVSQPAQVLGAQGPRRVADPVVTPRVEAPRSVAEPVVTPRAEVPRTAARPAVLTRASQLGTEDRPADGATQRASRRLEAGRPSRQAFTAVPTAYVRPMVEQAPEAPQASPWLDARTRQAPATRPRAQVAADAPVRDVVRPVETPSRAVSQAAHTAEAPRESSLHRAVRRAQAGTIDSPSVSMAAAPTSYVHAAEARDVEVQEPTHRDSPTLRAARRDVVVVREDERGRTLAATGAADYARAPSSSVMRRLRVAMPSAVVLRPASPEVIETTAAPATKASPRLESRLDRLTPAVRAALRAPEPTATVAERPASTHAHARLDAQQAPAPLRRIARRPTPYMSLLPAETGAEQREPQERQSTWLARTRQAEPDRAPSRRPQATTSVPEAPITRRPASITQVALREVIRKVSATVRALERSDDTVLVVEASRRAMGGEPAVRIRRVRAGAEDERGHRVQRDASGVLVPSVRRSRVLAPALTPVAPQRAESSEPQRAQTHMGWAEGRARVSAPTAGPATPGARTAARAYTSSPVRGRAPTTAFLTPGGETPGATRSTPVTRAAMRQVGTVSTPRPQGQDRAPVGFGFGDLGLPVPDGSKPEVDAVTGFPVDTRHASGWYSRVVDGRPAARTQRARPLGTTLRTLARRGPSAQPEPRAERVRPWRSPALQPRPRLTRKSLGASSLVLPEQSQWTTPHSEEPAPGWARRAVHGTGAVPTPAEEGARAAKSGIINALARAATPEEVVRLIVERGQSLRTAVRELAPPALRLIERVVEIDREVQQASDQTRVEHHYVPVQQYGFLGTRSSASSSAAPNMRGLAPQASAQSTAASAGSNRVMKLARKLQSLIHLAEAERKVKEARAQVRMAEDSADARAEGSAGPEKSDQEQTHNIKALQRDVLEAVSRELELRMLRRQEDPDGRNVWW